jgi:hypothetical protein
LLGAKDAGGRLAGAGQQVKRPERERESRPTSLIIIIIIIIIK